MKIYILCVSIILFFTYKYFLQQIQYLSNTNIISLENELRSKLVNQQNQISQIVYTISNLKNSLNNIQVITVLGSSGVGKTYTLNIVKKHFDSTQIYEIINQDFSKIHMYYTSEILNVVIIDDIRLEHRGHFLNYIYNIPKHKNQKYLILAAFNTQNTKDGVHFSESLNYMNDIVQFFNNTHLNVTHVVFNKMNKKIIEDHINSLFNNNVIIQESLRKVLEEHDIEAHGFKRICSKMNLEEICLI